MLGVPLIKVNLICLYKSFGRKTFMFVCNFGNYSKHLFASLTYTQATIKFSDCFTDSSIAFISNSILP